MPSNRPPEGEDALGRELDALESHWREALGELSRGDVAAAERAIGRADHSLAAVQQRRGSLPPGRLPSLRERLSALQGLHHQLVLELQRAQADTQQRLGEARRGRRALSGYAPTSPRAGGSWA